MLLTRIVSILIVIYWTMTQSGYPDWLIMLMSFLIGTVVYDLFKLINKQKSGDTLVTVIFLSDLVQILVKSFNIPYSK